MNPTNDNFSNWRQLSVGTFQKSTLKQSADFEKFKTRYLYFRALSEVDGKRWTSVAEFSVKYINTPATSINQKPLSEPISSVTPEVDLQDFEGVKVYPIPFKDKLFVKGNFTKKEIKSVKLIGVNGKQLPIKKSYDCNTLQIDVNTVNRGFYILRMKNQNNVKSFKVLKK